MRDGKQEREGMEHGERMEMNNMLHDSRECIFVSSDSAERDTTGAECTTARVSEWLRDRHGSECRDNRQWRCNCVTAAG